MTVFENIEAIELTEEQMSQADGGANRYKALTPKTGFIIYQVRKGDTLSKIARAHGCTERELMAWNPKITNKNRIYANEHIYIRM